MRPVLPFLPFPPFRTPGHGDMERRTTNSVTTNIKQWMLHHLPPLKCLDKTQIRGYSTDTAANNESYLHTPVMSDIVTNCDPWNDSWQLFGDNVWQLLSRVNTVMANHGTVLAQTSPITAIKSYWVRKCLLVIIKCQQNNLKLEVSLGWLYKPWTS